MPKFETDDPILNQYQNVTILGEPKSGKTLYAATADRDTSKILYLCADRRGYTTLLSNGLQPPVKYLEPGNPYNSAVDAIEDARDAIKDGSLDISTVVVDDIVTLQRQVKVWIEDTKEDEITSKNGKRDTWAVYGLLKSYMLDIVGRFEDFPAHVVYLSWLKEQSSDGSKLGGAMLEGKFKEFLEGNCNVTVLLRLKKVVEEGEPVYVRELIVDAWGGYNIGNRLRLPNPFPYDVELGEPGEPPTWEIGLAGMLNWVGKNTKKKKKSTKKRR